MSFFLSLAAARKNHTRWDYEFRVLLPKKGLRWLKVTSKSELAPDGSVAFFGGISDITVAKEQEIELRISEERLKSALDASTAGVWDWDLTTGKVFYSSQSMQILERESLDVVADPERWDDIVHPDDLAQYYSEIQDHFDGKTSCYENYHRVLTCSGTYKWILDRGKVVARDENGRPLRVTGTHTDISQQKEKEVALVKKIEAFSKQNSRLVNFSHIVSHNLNTQAGNIKSLLDFIDADDEEANRKEMLAHLRTVSNDLNETIAHLTQLVSIQSNASIPVQTLDLNVYLNKTLDLIRNVKNYDQVIVVNEIPVDSCVDFNPAYLESILLNFTTNAIKYSQPEKPIEIKYSFYVENGKKTLSIADKGLGIDLAKYGESLFGMYKTFHRHEEARGLGLFLTKNQIESMNGTVDVTSKVGVGTTFKIIFSDAVQG